MYKCGPFLFPVPYGPAGPISLKTIHWIVFRALDVPVPCPYCLLPAPSVTTGYFLFFTLKKLTKWAAKVTAQEMG